MSRLRLLFAINIFLGAFLLFLVEPMAARQLLPVLGGSAAVWITCLVFFQTALLLGYLYAHQGSRKTIWAVHIALLVAAAAGSDPVELHACRNGQRIRSPGVVGVQGTQRLDRRAVHRSGRNQSTAAALVGAGRIRRDSVAALRALKCRLVARSGALSLRSRAVPHPARAARAVVLAVRGVRAPVRSSWR